MSPLSDTTNLAPAVAGTDLFTHINHMIWTTGPSLLIALCIFLFMGFNASDTQNLEGLELIQSTIINNFNISTENFVTHINKSKIKTEIIKDNLDENILEDLLTQLISKTLIDIEIKNEIKIIKYVKNHNY